MDFGDIIKWVVDNGPAIVVAVIPIATLVVALTPTTIDNKVLDFIVNTVLQRLGWSNNSHKTR